MIHIEQPKYKPVFLIGLGLLLAVGWAAAGEVPFISPEGPLPSVLAGDHPDDGDAAADFCDYLSRVGGRAVSVSPTVAAAGMIVHVGADSFVRAQAPELNRLRGDGFVIKYVDVEGRRHLVLAGPQASSSQLAVERFLMNHCGVRWLFPDPEYGEVVPSRPVLTIPDTLAERYEPDFLSRSNCAMYMYTPNRKYLRLGPRGGPFGSHEIQTIFSTDEFAAHPEWFAFFKGKRQWWAYGNGWQICTTHPGTVERAVQYVDEYFRRNPDAIAASVGQNDGSGWCECETCAAFVDSFDPPYTMTERWFHWVNQVAREVARAHPGKWVEAMAYATTSEPPRFPLEDNVAITKTFVLEDEFELAEKWKSVCKSVNLYSYMYGNSFMGFRHYPRAAQEFLQWGHDGLGAIAHVAECGGDWSFDGPKYHYIQALQWDVNADVDAVMRDFCQASYGKAAPPMRAFWDRLEAVYDRRPPTPYGETRKRWLFYQWVSWAMNSYVQPNDEFVPYRLQDVKQLDRSIAEAIRRATEDTGAVQFRVDRVSDAWRYYRTLIISALKYYPSPPTPDVTSAEAAANAMQRARKIADLRAERRHYDQQMLRYPHINTRRAGKNFWSWSEASTLFSRESGMIDDLCTAVSAFGMRERNADGVRAFWQKIPPSDSLYDHARVQLYMLGHAPLKNVLINGGFESGTLEGWERAASETVVRDGARTGEAALHCSSTTSTLRQRVPVKPLEHYRLTAWAKYLRESPDNAVPAEAILDFYGGSSRVWAEPTRCLLPAKDPAAGWVRLRSTVTVPPGVDSVEIQLKRRSKGEHLWDDIAFERILAPPEITDGRLTDTFEGEDLLADTWIETAEHRYGPRAPEVRDGWAEFHGTESHPINSLARFDDLLAHEGQARYRLRFHAATRNGLPAEETLMAVGIQNGAGPISTRATGMFWYFYFSSAKRAEAMVSGYAIQGGSKTATTSHGLGHLPQPVTDVWYTLFFDPRTVEIYAAADGYDESPASLVATYEHGITNLPADGPVYLKLDAGDYRLDEINLTRPPESSDESPLHPDQPPDKNDPRRLIMPGVTE
jgi:hypothetical protein